MLPGNRPSHIQMLFIAIMASMILLMSQLNLLAHNPVSELQSSMERHLILDSEQLSHSVHSHDDGTQEETNPLHQHSHNSADHSHLSIYLFLTLVTVFIAGHRGLGRYNRRHNSPTPYPWQRPPKLNLC